MTDDIVTRLREETCHMPECCWLFTDAADEIEHRGLARTVGADQGEHLAGLHVEADLVDGLDAAKVHAQVVGLEQGG